MVYYILLQAEAISEIRDAFEWYEDQKEGLGYEFLEELETCYQKLSSHPQHIPTSTNLYRRIKTNRFPYLLVYEIEEDNIVINSVRHVKRKPL